MIHIAIAIAAGLAAGLYLGYRYAKSKLSADLAQVRKDV